MIQRTMVERPRPQCLAIKVLSVSLPNYAAEQAGPHQDADAAVHDRRHRVGNNVGQQRVHDVTQTLGTTSAVAASRPEPASEEQLAGHTLSAAAIRSSAYSQTTVPKRRSSLMNPVPSALATMTKTSTGAMPLQRADKQAAEFSQPYGAGADHQRQRRADKQTDGNTQDQAGSSYLAASDLTALVN